VTIVSGGLGIVEYRLIRDVDFEDFAEHVGGFSGTDGKRDV